VKLLQNLIKKDIPFIFDADYEKAFERLKKELTSSPTLRVYNLLAETKLHTDASSLDFGAILIQKQIDGHYAPIAYFSRVTTDCEKNYYSFELETLVIVKAVESFHIPPRGSGAVGHIAIGHNILHMVQLDTVRLNTITFLDTVAFGHRSFRHRKIHTVRLDTVQLHTVLLDTVRLETV